MNKGSEEVGKERSSSVVVVVMVILVVEKRNEEGKNGKYFLFRWRWYCSEERVVRVGRMQLVG